MQLNFHAPLVFGEPGDLTTGADLGGGGGGGGFRGLQPNHPVQPMTQLQARLTIAWYSNSCYRPFQVTCQKQCGTEKLEWSAKTHRLSRLWLVVLL